MGKGHWNYGLRAHLGCERWCRTPDYIPFASKFLKERYYDYAPAPYFKLSTGESGPTSRTRSDIPDNESAFPSAERLRDFLIASARAVGTVAECKEIGDTLESLAADVNRQHPDLEQLENVLKELEGRMIALVKSTLTEEQLAAVERELQISIEPYMGKMTAEQLKMITVSFFERSLLNVTNLPRLSLFYIR
jgi:hypothetical protein